MAITIVMRTEFVPDEEFFAARDALEATPSHKDRGLQTTEEGTIGQTLLFIRRQGNRPTSPCPKCAPYISMTHDKSGRTVPLTPLHHFCVCTDTPVEFDMFLDADGESTVGQRRFEWLAAQSDTDLRRILGAQRFAWHKQGAVPLEGLFGVGGVGTEVKSIKQILQDGDRAALLEHAVLSPAQISRLEAADPIHRDSFRRPRETRPTRNQVTAALSSARDERAALLEEAALTANADDVKRISNSLIVEGVAVSSEALNLARFEPPGAFAPALTRKEAEAWAAENLIDRTVSFRAETLRLGLGAFPAWSRAVSPEHTARTYYQSVSLKSANEINAAVKESLDRGLPRVSAVFARKVAGDPVNAATSMSADGELRMFPFFNQNPGAAKKRIAQSQALHAQAAAYIILLEKRIAQKGLGGEYRKRLSRELSVWRERAKYHDLQAARDVKETVYYAMGHHWIYQGRHASGDTAAQWAARVKEAAAEQMRAPHRYSISFLPTRYPVEKESSDPTGGRRARETVAESFVFYMRGDYQRLAPKMLGLFDSTVGREKRMR